MAASTASESIFGDDSELLIDSDVVKRGPIAALTDAVSFLSRKMVPRAPFSTLTRTTHLVGLI